MLVTWSEHWMLGAHSVSESRSFLSEAIDIFIFLEFTFHIFQSFAKRVSSRRIVRGTTPNVSWR